VLYVIGKYRIDGTPQVIGANLVEGTDVATDLPADPPTVFGNGTITLVYWSNIEDSADFIKGLGTAISGSWRDW